MLAKQLLILRIQKAARVFLGTSKCLSDIYAIFKSDLVSSDSWGKYLSV